jgi:hypothetical protein
MKSYGEGSHPQVFTGRSPYAYMHPAFVTRKMGHNQSPIDIRIPLCR